MVEWFMKKLYVGCGLTHAPEEFRKSVEDLKGALRKDYDLLDFVGLKGKDHVGVYRHDIENCVKRAEIFLAIADHPSTGLGWELAVAAEKGMPILVAAHKEAKVTKLLLGAVEQFENMAMFRYELIEEVIKELALAQ